MCFYWRLPVFHTHLIFSINLKAHSKHPTEVKVVAAANKPWRTYLPVWLAGYQACWTRGHNIFHINTSHWKKNCRRKTEWTNTLSSALIRGLLYWAPNHNNGPNTYSENNTLLLMYIALACRVHIQVKQWPILVQTKLHLISCNLLTCTQCIFTCKILLFL